MKRSTSAILTTLTIALLGTTPGYTSVRGVSKIEVAGNGHTPLSMVTDGIVVEAEIVTRIQPGQNPVRDEVAACTQTRIPCSLVKQLHIRVGKSDIQVPNSIVLRLADVDRASLHSLAAGNFELVLECGDASGAYDAHVLFDTKRVTQLDIIDGEAGMMAERTVYADMSHAFDN